jgi:hypothetical protein
MIAKLFNFNLAQAQNIFDQNFPATARDEITSPDNPLPLNKKSSPPSPNKTYFYEENHSPQQAKTIKL